jgi:hypothetical protein
MTRGEPEKNVHYLRGSNIVSRVQKINLWVTTEETIWCHNMCFGLLELISKYKFIQYNVIT